MSYDWFIYYSKQKYPTDEMSVISCYKFKIDEKTYYTHDNNYMI